MTILLGRAVAARVMSLAQMVRSTGSKILGLRKTHGRKRTHGRRRSFAVLGKRQAVATEGITAIMRMELKSVSPAPHIARRSSAIGKVLAIALGGILAIMRMD